MRTEIKKEWLEALRSGNYTQATGALRRTTLDGDVTGHCCLGVLCDIHAKAFQENKLWHVSPGLTFSRYYSKCADLPAIVCTWADVSNDPHIPRETLEKLSENRTGIQRALARYTSRTITLAGLNDVDVPFAEIADIIEEAL